MSAMGLYPKFGDLDGYKAWKITWRKTYKTLSEDILRSKLAVKAAQRAGESGAAKRQSDLHYKRVMARKMMTLIEDAKKRRDRIIKMTEDIEAQKRLFPLVEENCKLDFHFNRAHNEFFGLPRWVIKMKGKTFYLNHVDANAPWSTHEMDGSTKGTFRFRNVRLELRADNSAVITKV